MKNLFVLLGLLLALSISAQTNLRKNGKFKALGRQFDTLVASQTVNYNLELGDDVYGVMTIAVESDTVSGTSAYSSYLQKSMNGEDYVNVDTIAHSGGNPDYEEFEPVNTTHPYWRISTVATATAQKSFLKLWGRVDKRVIIQ
jgi:hypothetical protein